MQDEPLHAKLIVPDTGPLITLAAADSLDYLLYPAVPVYVPDAVLYEPQSKATRLARKVSPNGYKNTASKFTR
jgi:hypothetical protein